MRQDPDCVEFTDADIEALCAGALAEAHRTRLIEHLIRCDACLARFRRIYAKLHVDQSHQESAEEGSQ